MTPEEHKYYKARNGERVGPMSYFALQPGAVIQKSGDSFYWRSNGEATYAMKRAPEWDLIAEWTDGPVRTVTRREVVPGVWSGVEVGAEVIGAPNGPSVLVAIGTKSDSLILMDRDQLKAAAAVLLELAGALE